MKTLAVHVIDEDILNGTPAKTAECPIAVAVLREHPELSAAQVGGITMMTWDAEHISTRWLLPSAARMFVVRTDSLKPVEPFKFTAIEYQGTAGEYARLTEGWTE